MYTVQALIADAIRQGDEDAQRAIVRVLEKKRNEPAVVVTVREGKTHRRYVVAQEDEHRFDGFTPFDDDNPTTWHSNFYFGCQWLRGYKRVDEMYRTLSSHEVVKVQRIDRNNVWGG